MISIVNYGLGNIGAFANVYKRLNIPVKISSRKEDLSGAKKIILPGVGSFDNAMTLLNKSGMRDRLDIMVLQEKVPVLGICVGMQILSNSSEEGKLPGLGWIEGQVRKFDESIFLHKTRLPHMGWNTVEPLTESPLFNKIKNGSRFYFLHSYYFSCINVGYEISHTNYGIIFASAVCSGNIFGVQFHPEKSHKNGIQLLKNFAIF